MGSLDGLLARAGTPDPAPINMRDPNIGHDPVLPGVDRSAADRPPDQQGAMVNDIIIVADVAAHLPISVLPNDVIHDLKQLHTWPNPGFLSAKKYKTMVPQDKYLYGYYEQEGCISFPRGSLRAIIARLHRARIRVELLDATTSAPLADPMIANVSLNREQQDAWHVLYGKRFGILNGAGGDGDKKVTAHLIGARKERTLIVVKQKQQLYQWKTAILAFTSATENMIGLVGDRHCDVDRQIVIATDRSLYPHIESVKKAFGFLIVDRCDVANMKIFYRIVWHHPARYLLGISHSKKHHGGLTPMMMAFLGNIRAELTGPDDSLSKPVVVPRETGINFTGSEYDPILSEICENKSRNELIVADVLSAAASKKRVVVVAARVAHLEILAAAVEKNFRSTGMVTGKTAASALSKLIDAFHAGGISVLFTTTKSIPSDVLPPGNDVFVVSPYKYQDTAAQLVRCASGPKPGRIVDYIDAHPFTRASWEKRRLSYTRLGININTCQEKSDKK